MLKKINPVISPQLLKILCEMGHGDEIVIADANFPSQSVGGQVVRADGIDACALVEAVIGLIPLDNYADENVFLMEKVSGDKVETPIWEKYKAVINSEESGKMRLVFLERFAFYERAKKAYAVVATGEKALYANIILKKGVVEVL